MKISNLLALTVLVFPHPVVAAGAGPLVRTVQGELRGTSSAGVDAFLGVPYAEPPVGQLRWRDPVPAKDWSGVRDATQAAPACYQQQAKSFGPYTSEFLIGNAISEDCLYLNIWKPAHLSGPVPVLFYIHGGGFNSGSGSVPIYDGAALARRGIVVVTFNYRVGVFGFLAHRELTKESGKHSSGNFGLLDQIEALRWVRANIGAFGGNPRQVTIAGQSAGAASVNDLISSPIAKGMFQRAIAQSGSGMGVAMPSLEEAELTGQRVLAKAGVTHIAEFRTLPADAILAASEIDTPKPGAMPALLFAPNFDGVVLTGDPANGASPIESNVPLLTGFNDQEAGPPPATGAAAAFEAMVRGRYGNFAQRLLSLYPHSDDAEASSSWKTLARDRYMASLILWTTARTTKSNQTIYTYLFTHAYPGKGWSGAPSAFHTAEVPYVFGTVRCSGLPLSASDRAMERMMQSAWIDFMRSGRPSLNGLHWPAARPASLDVMLLGDRPTMQAAISTPERFTALRDYVASGGTLSLF